MRSHSNFTLENFKYSIQPIYGLIHARIIPIREHGQIIATLKFEMEIDRFFNFENYLLFFFYY